MAKKENLETFHIEGGKFKTQLTDAFKNRAPWTRPDEKLIQAYIPGKILKIFVKEGQKIRAEAKLLILEAMKMKNIVVSPVSGIVKKILVKEGDQVPKKTILIEIE